MTHHHRHADIGDHAHRRTPATDGEDMVECPVMPGTLVSRAEAEEAGLVRDHDGTRYWLCCETCASLWDADPTEYLRV